MRRTTLSVFAMVLSQNAVFLNIPCISSIDFLSVKHNLRHMHYSLENGRLFITGTAVNILRRNTEYYGCKK